MKSKVSNKVVKSKHVGSEVTRSTKVASFKISPKSVLNHDPLKDGYESESLRTRCAKSGKKPSNPVVVEGFGKRNMFPKKVEKKGVPDSNRVVPGMPNAIKSKGTDQIGQLLITDIDIKFKSTALNEDSQYTSAQQIVMAGRPVAWSMTSSAITSTINSVNPSISQEPDQQGRYDPTDKSGHETSRKRVNNIIQGVSDAVMDIKAPTEAQYFNRSADETRNLAFSAVPYLPWEASKIMPIDKFDPHQPYMPAKVNLLHEQVSKESIVDNHCVLQNPALNRKYKDFNRTACGFGQW